MYRRHTGYVYHTSIKRMAGINRPLGPLQLIASGQNSITTCTFWALSTDYEQQQQQQEEQEREGPQVRGKKSCSACAARLLALHGIHRHDACLPCTKSSYVAQGRPYSLACLRCLLLHLSPSCLPLFFLSSSVLFLFFPFHQYLVLPSSCLSCVASLSLRIRFLCVRLFLYACAALFSGDI